MRESINQIFLGCNYNDKKIKAQFDNLKKRLENTTPLACVIVDKRRGKSAKDIWKDIKKFIETSAVCIFDVTGFRPNVVLELGYALSIKAEEQIFITFRKRKSKGKIPQWLLSDIGHLNRYDYIHMADLEQHVREQLKLIAYGSGWQRFLEKCQNINAGDKYGQKGMEILQIIRDEGPKNERQIKQIMTRTACRFRHMIQLLRSEGLIMRSIGKYGRFSIPVSQ
ncbi:MAG: hypothetical protein PHW98_06875 [Candidatus Omnitrophica bacterium]|nr:hypothetical protein [Candidatus Omnitrophota bacterium]